ncbi:FABP family protein [Actinomyces sp. 594]|uniref:FABP family protein n=1 Tax=Actinomyces sp. 594 TaxID=2057793 RepID=UPI001C58A275|nr:FABP family protein [Actinomyces sp. 594]MBW3068045.1 FABP family protein [Actinomyces sp. 594]
MAFTIPDDLSPELYPLAWLVGTWRGYGILTYGETVPEQAVYQEMTFDHDGGPYLRQTTTIWTVDATRSQDLDFEMPGLEGASRLTPAQVWSTETTFWRPVGQEMPEAADDGGEAGGGEAGSGGGASSPASKTPITSLELVSADPAGHVGVWEGWIQGPRAQVGTQAVGRTRTAASVTEMSRMFGLVGGELLWTQDMAAFGQEEAQSYASGRLGRVEEAGETDPGAALREAIAADEATRAAEAVAAGAVAAGGSSAVQDAPPPTDTQSPTTGASV